MADNNQIILLLPHLRDLNTQFKTAGENLRVEKKELSGFSGKSDVLDKYAELYKTLCEAIEQYCDLVEHDSQSIAGVIDNMESADASAATAVNQGLYLFGVTPEYAGGGGSN